MGKMKFYFFKDRAFYKTKLFNHFSYTRNLIFCFQEKYEQCLGSRKTRRTDWKPGKDFSLKTLPRSTGNTLRQLGRSCIQILI